MYSSLRKTKVVFWRLERNVRSRVYCFSFSYGSTVHARSENAIGQAIGGVSALSREGALTKTRDYEMLEES